MLASIYGKMASTALWGSMALHATAGGSFYLWVVMTRTGNLQEIELTSAPLVPRSASAQAVPMIDDDWFLAQKHRKLSKAPEQKKETPSDATPCKGNCQQGATGFGEFIPASDAARKPKWVGNFITPNDYPLLAKQQGKDGRVVLSVIIDNEGRVRDAQLLEGSYEALNEVALAKVREAVFSPAYDKDGNAVACKVRLPIRFELK